MARGSWHVLPMAVEPSPSGQDIPRKHLGGGWVAGELIHTFPDVKSHELGIPGRQAGREIVPVSTGGLQPASHQTPGCGWEDRSSCI